MALHFTAPEAAVGKDVVTIQGLRIRAADPDGASWGGPTLLAPLVVENTQPQIARLKADRSCVVDPEYGAVNLLWQDAVVPGGCWTTLHAIAPQQPGPYWAALVFSNQRQSVRPGKQRLFLGVDWADGRTANIEFEYEVRPAD